MTIDDLSWIIIWLTLSQTIEMMILIMVVKRINKKVEALAPEGKSAGRMIAEAGVEFMGMLGEQSPEGERTRMITGTFVRTMAATAFEEVKGKIPILGGGGGDILSPDLMDKLAKKSPLAAVGLQLANSMAPMVLQQMQKGGVNNAPTQSKGRGNIGYG